MLGLTRSEPAGTVRFNPSLALMVSWDPRYFTAYTPLGGDAIIRRVRADKGIDCSALSAAAAAAARDSAS